jgi:hypothetical protein
VLKPLKVVLENYPEGQVEQMDVVNNPEDPSAGTRQVPVLTRAVHRARRLPLDPPKKFFRLAPGREVRLRNAYLITVPRGDHRSGNRRGRRAALHVRCRPRAVATPRTAAR